MSHPILTQLSINYDNLSKEMDGGALLLREFAEESRHFDQSALQESFSWRNVHVARLLATSLIDEHGQIDKKELFAAIENLEKARYSLGPARHYDDERQDYLLNLLHHLHDDPSYEAALKKISKPVSHLACERLIRETLGLPARCVLKDVHARRAALSALLTWLRQNVGSCFATAPAILVEKTQPLQFLKDMAALMGTGRLVRIIEGSEYAVPLSISWGAGLLFVPIMNTTIEKLAASPGLQAALGKNLEKRLGIFEKKVEKPFSVITADEIIRTLLLHEEGISEPDVRAYLERESAGVMGRLLVEATPSTAKHVAADRYLKKYDAAKSRYKALTENALLRAWEYTLASLSESKADFASWNLYSSLGLSPEEEGGIGIALRDTVQEMIDALNREVEEYQSKYEHLFATVKYLEGRMKRADEREIGWLSADYRIRRQEIDRLLSERDEAASKGQQLASFFQFVIQFASEKFKDYFQEVYDAEMHSLSDSPYDDSPAGFRLLYKHGRSNTALWTLIHSEAEFLQALSSFFSAIEVELTQQEQAEGLTHEVGRMMTAIILQIKEPRFIELAKKRLRAAYRDPKRLPWAYISGGTMHTLVSCYYSLSNPIKEQKRYIESPTELLAFYIDTIKNLPLSEQKAIREFSERSLLAYSPTHAFLVQPALFEEAWDNDIYTYSWIRDEIVHPAQAFLDEQQLNRREIDYLIDKLLIQMPKGYQPVVKQALDGLSGPFYPFEFRDKVIEILTYQKWIHQGALEFIRDEIDALLFQHLPLFPEYELPGRLEALFQEMEELDREKTHLLCMEAQKLPVGRYHLFSSADLLEVAKGLLLTFLQTTRSFVPFHQRIMRTMRALGFAHPSPLIVGDTNWVKKRFAFLVGPGSRELELWCVDSCGGEGRPLSIWKPYLDGRDQRDWGLFTSPAQYGQY